MYKVDIFQDSYLFVSLCVFARERGINRFTDANACFKVRQCVRLTKGNQVGQRRISKYKAKHLQGVIYTEIPGSLTRFLMVFVSRFRQTVEWYRLQPRLHSPRSLWLDQSSFI